MTPHKSFFVNSRLHQGSRRGSGCFLCFKTRASRGLLPVGKLMRLGGVLSNRVRARSEDHAARSQNNLLRNINVWNGNGKHFDAPFYKVQESCVEFGFNIAEHASRRAFWTMDLKLPRQSLKSSRSLFAVIHRSSSSTQLELGTLSSFYIPIQSSRMPDQTPMSDMRFLESLW